MAPQVGFRLEECAQALERLKRRLVALQQAGAAEPAEEGAPATPAADGVGRPEPASPEPASPGPASAASAADAEAQEHHESRTAQRRQLEVYPAL